MKRVVVLIDGQNLFYCLKDMGISDQEIDWDKFLKSFISQEDELIRTYWFRPQKILDTHLTSYNIRQHIVFFKYKQYLSDYNSDKSKIPQAILEKIEQEAKDSEKWLQDEKIKFSYIESKYDKLSSDFQDLEIVKKGIVKVDPYEKKYLSEKGVDITLAVKMISLSVQNSCDKIILVSGDYDYAEAIHFVKDRMMKIHIVKFHRGQPPKNRYTSRELAFLADNLIDVYEVDIKANYIRITPHIN